MDKPFRDMDALCQTTAKEREERYRISCRMVEISKMLLSGDEIVCDGGAELRVPICNETPRDMVGELQDMIEFIESMEQIEDYNMDDTLMALEANILAYNFTCDLGDYDG